MTAILINISHDASIIYLSTERLDLDLGACVALDSRELIVVLLVVVEHVLVTVKILLAILDLALVMLGVPLVALALENVLVVCFFWCSACSRTCTSIDYEQDR